MGLVWSYKCRFARERRKSYKVLSVVSALKLPVYRCFVQFQLQMPFWAGKGASLGLPDLGKKKYRTQSIEHRATTEREHVIHKGGSSCPKYILIWRAK